MVATTLKIIPKVVDIYHDDVVASFDDAYGAGIRGVIHKVLEGTSKYDPEYARRRPVALKAGHLWGAYHFIRPEAIDTQAARFVKAAEPDDVTLIAVDYEDEHTSLASVRAFIEQVEDATKRTLKLYSGFMIKEQIANASDDDKEFFAARPLWLCHYNPKPTWPRQWKAPWLWQFAADGNGPKPHVIPGIHGKNGTVDLNSFAGTHEDLAAQWAGLIKAAA